MSTTTKSRPILFSAPMVLAILDGRKTQTRRVVKPQPPDNEELRIGNYCPAVVGKDGIETPGKEQFGAFDIWGEWSAKCPYGQPGDELWVRETWAPSPFTQGAVVHKAGFEAADSVSVWRPSIHMPRWASRITLTITGVRVERLQDISGADARAEGCQPDWDAFHEATEAMEGWQEPEEFIEECEEECDWVNFGRGLVHSSEHKEWQSDRESFARRQAFQHLWKSINGPDSWDANPWVWVVEFERKAWEYMYTTASTERLMELGYRGVRRDGFTGVVAASQPVRLAPSEVAYPQWAKDIVEAIREVRDELQAAERRNR